MSALDDLIAARQTIDKMRRIIVCSPEQESAVREALEKDQTPLVEVRVNRELESGTVYVMPRPNWAWSE